MAFYNSTNGPGWRYSTGWLQTNTPCSWASISCAGGSVVDMAFYDLGVDGPLPAEFGNLSNLEHFECELCGLTGSIPAELGKLSKLRLLWLMDNYLTGSIPAQLGNLTHLQFLYLYDNQLTGAIPAELGNLSSLMNLYLGGNQLTGAIPAEFGNLSSLMDLQVADNHLTGGIPAELGNLDLRQLILSGNELTGAIPTELGSLSGLTTLHLNDNLLSGLLPLSVAAVGGSLLASWQCFFTPGNSGLYMPDVPAYRTSDTDNDGLICGLGFTTDVSTVAGDIGSVLDDLLAAGIVNGGQANALMRKIDQALELVAKGKNAEAIAVLQNFTRQVNDLTDVVFTSAQANELIKRADIMIQLM